MAISWLQLIFYSYWMYISVSVSALSVNDYYHSNAMEQSRLMFDLLEYYDDRIPPTEDGPVQVSMGFTMSYFDFLDEANQQARVHIWSPRRWTDPRLRWDPSAYNNTENILIDIGKIWIPDIELYNGATFLDTLKASAIINSTGTVSFVPSFQINFICDMNLRYFPYDTQTCSIKMGSWHYHAKTLNLSLSSAGPDLSHLMPVKDFILLDVKAERNLRTYPCCKEEYIDVTYSLTLKRKSSAYNTKLVLPSVLAGFLVLGTFLVPNTSYERLTLCVVLFLCLIHLLSYLHDILPTSGDTILGQLLVFALFIDFFAIILAVLSYNLQSKGQLQNEGDGEHEMKIQKPSPKKKGLELLRLFNIVCFILFAFIFIVGLAVILSRRG